MNTEHENQAVMAVARANTYGLLARVFRSEPSPEFLSSLLETEFSSALGQMGISTESLFDGNSPGQLAEVLAGEFARLFIGPGPRLSPHQSLHVETSQGDNEYWSEETVQVKRFMAAAGVTLADSFTGMPDHLAAELEFMQKLAEQEALHWRAGEAETAGNVQAIQRRFFDEHLGRWVPAFCDKLTAASSHPYFKEMAELTRDFMIWDQAILDGNPSAAAAP